MRNIVTILAVLSVIWISFIVWARIDTKRRKKNAENKKDKPTFRTEENLDEYGKPMADKHQSKVDFEDTEWD